MKYVQAVIAFIWLNCFFASTLSVFAHVYSIASVDDIRFEAYTHYGALYFQINATTPDVVQTISILSNSVPAATIPTSLLKDQQTYDFKGTASFSGNVTTPQLNEEWAQSGNTTLAEFEPSFDGSVTTLMIDDVEDGTVSLSFQMTDGTVKIAEVSLKPIEEIPHTPGAPSVDHSAHGGSTTSQGEEEADGDGELDHSAHSAEEHAQFLEGEAIVAAKDVEEPVNNVVKNSSNRSSAAFTTLFGAVLLIIT